MVIYDSLSDKLPSAPIVAFSYAFNTVLISKCPGLRMPLGSASSPGLPVLSVLFACPLCLFLLRAHVFTKNRFGFLDHLFSCNLTFEINIGFSFDKV